MTPQARAQSRARILSIEDWPEFMELIARALRRGGLTFDIERVDSAPALEAALRERRFDVVISDNRMPAFSAVEALQVLRAHDANVPFVVVSSLVDDAHAAQLRALGASDVLPKEDLDRLVGVVRALLDRARAHTEPVPLDAVMSARLLDTAPDAIIVVDDEGSIRLLNQQARRLFGYEDEEIVGRPIEILVPESARTIHPQRRAKYMRDPGTRPMGMGLALAGRRKDGTEFPVDISLSSIETPHGVLVSAAVRDTTERKKLAARFQGLLEAAPDAIVAVDAAGVIRLVNRQAERLFGYAREELLGQPIETLIPDRTRAIHSQHRAKYMSDPRPRPMGTGLELSGRRKDGTEFPADISLASIETEDGLLVSAAVRDITDRREMQVELRLRQSQRLESVGQLAGGIAHDFNNLLAIILNYSRFAIEQLDAGNPARADIEQARAAAERAAALVRQLLLFSRREVTRPVLMDLGESARELDTILRRTLGEHVRLDTVVPPGIWPTYADPTQIQQVLMNLAVNARDAMPNGGTLNIALRNVELSAADAAERGMNAGRFVELAVADTGVGMSAEVQAHAFEPFFTTKPPGQGTGLGLSTVYGIVTQAGGNVHLYSEPGRGTVIRVYLPAAEGSAQTDTAKSAAVRAAAGETVFVVEDEDGVRAVLRRILERAGYKVVDAGSPSAALTAIQKAPGRIDLLITDMVMPEMSGRDLAAIVRKLRPDIRVLYSSGYTEEVVGQKELDAPLLEKPFTENDLLSSVGRALAPQPPKADA